MRLLVPLLTAAALAISGWLATGVVTVRSLHAPARIGLLAPPHVLLTFLLIFLLPLLALSGRGIGNAGRWRTVWRAALLLVPVALPWLPLPLPPALLTWTGPLAIAWWAASIAYVYADACGASAPLGERALPRLLGSPTAAPLVAAAIIGALLAATAWHTGPRHPKGDEPDYLVIAQSLWLDGDLKIEDNHARADYWSYHPNVLPASYLARGTDGAIYSVHAPGLPALLVPGLAVAGYRGAVATLVLFAMFGAWLAWRVSWDVTGDVSASWVGTLATVGAAPYFLHGAAIFPDAPASVLALYAVSVLMSDGARIRDAGAMNLATDASATRPYLFAALALGMLPWLHTRYAILAVGLGATIALTLASRRQWRALAMFATPAVMLAAAWFGCFFVIYGTPSPSAPYGAYTQMAVAHLRPGLPGLLFDQQFGLLASAPVLVVALVSLRSSVREAVPHIWRRALIVLVLGLCYTGAVAAYRMWWGGLSAPARFLVPLVLPLAPFIALGWRSLRTRASRHLAVGLLTTSLALTATLVVVDHGALAYNTRDGRARWAAWASPLVDLVAALPAAHRDAPGVVMRDAGIWMAALASAWALWRGLERRGRLTPLVSLMSVAVVVPAASETTRGARGVSGLAPAASQVRYLDARPSSSAHLLVAITPPPVGRTRTWFNVELEGRRPHAALDYTALRLDDVSPGRYRLFTDVRAPGARLGVTLGDGRASRFLADLDAGSAHVSLPFTLALPAVDLVVKGSREAIGAPGRTWLVADEVWPRRGVPPATRTVPIGGDVWLLPADGIYPEADGAWLAGDADVTIGLPGSRPLQVSLRAGPAIVGVSWSGTNEGAVQLAAGETRVVTMAPEQGRLRLRTRGGFRPSRETPGSDDQRYLSAWLSVR